MVGTGVVTVQPWSHFEEIAHVQRQRRSPRKMVGGAKLHLETDLIPTREVQRTQTNLLHTRIQGPQRDWNRTLSPVVVRVKTGLPQGQGFWVQQTCLWHMPSWRRSPLTPPLSHHNLHRTGETDSWRAETEPCVHQDPAERSTDPQETDQDLPTSV